MEIQKIFSDLEGREKIFSVLMSDKEYNLFNEIQSLYSDNAEGSSIPVDELLELGALGGTVGGVGLGSYGLYKKHRLLKEGKKKEIEKAIEHIKQNPHVAIMPDKSGAKSRAKDLLSAGKGDAAKMYKRAGIKAKIGAGLLAAGLASGGIAYLKNKHDNEV